MIGKTISHYKILEKIGEGGMGVVYKAQDTKLDRTVALKFLPKHLLRDEEAKTRFVHEAKAASALNHTNITTIYEIDEVEDQCFISMEYIDGKSLKELLKEKTLSLKEILDIAIQIGEGLNTAHKKDITHRDIKSDNIMLTDEGVVKIMDFGLAKLKGVTKLTKTGATLGTIQYMSPEQAQGMEVDQRSDIFSFGVVLYEMTTGQLPFKGEHEAAIIYAIVNETPEPLARYKAKVPEGLQRILDKALEKDRETRYQTSDDMAADLKRLKRMTEKGVPLQESRVLMPEPGKRSIAVMYFEDFTGDEDIKWLSRGLPHMLITDLEQSKFIEVVGYQRLFDILKLLGKEDVERISASTATQVAKRAGVTTMLLGSIFKSGNRIRIDYEVQDVNYGKLIYADKVMGEEPLALADELGNQIRLRLDIDPDRDPSKRVADVTTHSPEAYRYYLEGVDNYYKYYFTEAEKSFKKALEFDSTFAMAYFWLALFKGGSEHSKLIAKAVEYSDKVSQKEKHYIKALEAGISGNYAQAIKELKKIVERYPEEKEAFYWIGVTYYKLGQFEEAVRHFNKAIEIDPLYKLAYNDLAYAYDQIGDFEKSIWAINKYISLAPDEANPYDSRGELYAWNGKIDKAIESFKKALEIKSDFYISLFKLGHMYLFKREYAKAESCYQKLCSSSEKDTRSEGRTYLAYIPLYQGKLDRALEVLDDGIAADRMEQAEGEQNAWKHVLKATIYEEKKNLNLALKEAEICMEIHKKAYPDHPLNFRDFYAYILAENGEIAKAEEVARALKKDIEEKNPTLIYNYSLALGAIEQAKGNTNTAVTYKEKAAKEAPSPLFQVRFSLA
ncbi:MAG: protein kinase, partial [candidate division Zixibacteria bacterium]|nr:protein kinase [candidate division Zixibacteria bacterium]